VAMQRQSLLFMIFDQTMSGAQLARGGSDGRRGAPCKAVDIWYWAEDSHVEHPPVPWLEQIGVLRSDIISPPALKVIGLCDKR
jgi:hypothetical protein